MKNHKKFIRLFLLASCFLVITIGCGDSTEIHGESLVLPAVEPGKLCFEEIRKNSVVVRSTYLADNPACRIYQEGTDYVVDYQKGEIARTINSAIPDYSKHPLFGRKDFDHTHYEEYSNLPYFVWVDYTTKNNVQWAEPNEQSIYLTEFRKKLETGVPVTIVSYGNSITDGGEASSNDLRFQFRYAEYLKSKFPKADITVEDVSISGRTAKEGIDYWDDYIGKTDPDLVLVGWGMNDHCIGVHEPDQFRKYLVTLVEMIKERKEAEVMLFSTFPANVDWHYSDRSMEPYAEATKQAAREAQCAYVDVYSTWAKVLQRKDQPSVLANNINHPNDFGHWLYLKAFEATIF